MEEKELSTEFENNTQSRRYMLTINNPEYTDEQIIKYIEDLEHFKYCMFQREKGEETGTEHIQAFIVFSIAKRFSTIKKYFPRAHIEHARGSNVQCRDYCSKSDTRVSGPYELGEFAEQRARTDIMGFMDMIAAGATNAELRTAYPTLFFKNFKKIEQLRQDYLYEKFRNTTRFLEVTYLYGRSGAGKSRSVVEQYGFENVFRVTDYGAGMFDYYAGQDVIVFEEFDSSLKITQMLNFLDIYPLVLPCRFANKVACYTKVFICSNLSIYSQYPNIQAEKQEQFNAFFRRIHKIIKFTESGQEVQYDSKIHGPIRLGELPEYEQEKLPF